MLLLAFPTCPPALIHHYGGRLAPLFALLVVACGGAVQSDDAGCLDVNCGGATQSSAGGSALPATTGTGSTTAAKGGSFSGMASGGNAVVPIDPGDGGTSSGGASVLPVSVIVTQDAPQTSVDLLAGVHFSVTVDPPSTSIFYDFPAVPPTLARERNFCGYLTTYIFTCNGNQAGCLSITIDSMLHATALFTDSDSLTHELVGYVSAVKAPLSPLSSPPEHSLVGDFRFTGSDGIPLEIIGSFSVLIDNGTSATGTYLIIC